MSLQIGQQLGSYQITSLIGKGGMGEVYRAKDTKLKRDVAIKILPEEFSRNTDRVSRFQREAESLAALNHQNIAGIYDLQQSDATRFLILEFVEGDTLADILKKRGALPVDEALPIAKQICEALEAAHEKGIIHRDLKPANVKITPDGKVKVLDFGLAKAFAGEATDANLSNSPTLSMATEADVILGTAAYMAPEQARGTPVDKRADVWAFGVVLYELLTGKGLFTGESTTDVLAAVVRSEPDWNALPASTPTSIRRLLKRCLEKDRKRRLPDIGVARLEIDEAFVPPEERVASAPSTKRPNTVTWLVAAVSLLTAALLAGAWWANPRVLPEMGWTGVRLGGSTVAFGPRISPDGQTLAFLAMVDGLTQAAVMIPETGNWTVLTHDRSRGLVNNLSWSRDGTKLYFDRFDDAPGGIFSVPVLGGEERLVVDDAVTPEALPDGSLVVARLNSERKYQLHRVWPESGRVQPLNALLPAGVNSELFRVTPSGDRVVFWGRPVDDPDPTDHLYALELGAERILRLAPSVSFPAFAGWFHFPLAVAADGRSALVDLPSADLHRVVSVPIDGSNDTRTLLTLTSPLVHMDVGSDGSLYTDQWERPIEVLRISPSGGIPERIGVTTGDSPAMALPLPDGRFLVTSRSAGRERLLLMASGKEPVPFLETSEETAGPAALIGQTQVAFVIGQGSDRTIALASLADRRVTRRLSGPKGAGIGDSMASSPDGRTIYYTASGSVWAIPVTDGQPQKLRAGDGLTVDPYKQDLVVLLSEQEGVRLVRMPLTGGPERPIPVDVGTRLAPAGFFYAAGKDGRIVTHVAASWFWPAGLLDPQTGRVQILRVGYDYDAQSAAWTPDGKIAVMVSAMRSSLWRFRTEGSKP